MTKPYAIVLLAGVAAAAMAKPVALNPIEQRIYDELQRPSSASERAATPLPEDPARTVRMIRPTETDPSIRHYLKDDYVMLGRQEAGDARLFVFFPGSYGRPANYQWILDRAVRRGYRAIALEYDNVPTVAALCASDPDPDCAGRARLEKLTGEDASADIEVGEAESIDNRLAKLLMLLDERYPEEGWRRYLAGAAPNWPQIAVGGHSQGAGMAAFIAKRRLVARVTLFSGGADYSGAAGDFASWVKGESKTPLDRWFAAYHVDERSARFLALSYRALGLDPAQVLRLTAAPREEGRSALAGIDVFHGSVVSDALTPLGEDGQPLYASEWSFIVGEGGARPGGPAPNSP